MKIIKITPRGYCKGVMKAITLAKKTREQNPEAKIYVLGKIVHNTYISKALEELNIITLDEPNKSRLELLDLIDEGFIIFSAHGIDSRVYNKALSKNLKIVDASCIDVLKTQNLVDTKLSSGYKVIYIGKYNHPEANAVISDKENIYLVTKVQDLHKLKIESDKIYVTNQTTMSIYEIQEIFNEIRVLYPNAIIEEEICNATRLRQEAIINSQDIDLLYVVGDTLSNNSNKLKEIALKSNIKKAILIDDAKGIDIRDLNNNLIVGVTSGASTPTYLTNGVISALEYYKENQELPEIEIDISKLI